MLTSLVARALPTMPVPRTPIFMRSPFLVQIQTNYDRGFVCECKCCYRPDHESWPCANGRSQRLDPELHIVLLQMRDGRIKILHFERGAAAVRIRFKSRRTTER